LRQRPPTGVWAGLYTQPIFEAEDRVLSTLPQKWRHLLNVQTAFTHVLTHKDLHIHACHLALPKRMDLGEGAWFSPSEWPALGLPAPVRKLLERS
jgi:A/G-specific adenine glycosylase